MTVTVGLIANPVSARDIRRVIANASNLQIAERVSIVLRALSAMHACGVERVLMMPDRGGIRALLQRSLQREHNLHHSFPAVEFLDMPVTSTVDDTFVAARRLREAGVAAIVVLGGDGTHRAVVRECAEVPIAGLSTGTNNAFPELREPTITGMAVGLYASGRIAAADAIAHNKRLDVHIAGASGRERRDIAIVDAVISTERFVGARALWKTENLAAAYVTFADPQAIGLSAIAGLLQPVGRREPGGLAVHLADDSHTPRVTLRAPIAPGMVKAVGIADWAPLRGGEPQRVRQRAGVVALDGERELAFDESEQVTITLVDQAFPTVDVARCMHAAAAQGLTRHLPPAPNR